MGTFSNAVFVIISLNLLATTGDIHLSWTSPIFPKLYSNDSTTNPLGEPITLSQDAILGSILNFGAILGPLPFNFISNRFGRKDALLCLAVPHIVCFLTMAFAKNLYVFYTARFLAGLSLGAGYSLLPLYIGEIAEDSNRGAMTLTLNIFWSIGNFLPLVVGPYTSMMEFNLILTLIPVLFLTLFWLIGTESPYVLVKNNKEAQAADTLLYLRSNKIANVDEEIEKIKEFLEIQDDGKLYDIITDPGLRKSLVICVFLLATQDLGGYCSITYHLELIFQTAQTNVSSDLSSLIVGVAMVISSFIAPFFVDRLGRKPLIVCSCGGMCLSLASLGTFFYLHNLFDVSYFKWVPVLSLIVYILSFNLGIATVPWTLVSELFPDNVKGITASVCSTCSWATTFVVTLNYNALNEYLGIYSTFWLFSGWCLLATITSILFVPETRGKSFRQIQDMRSID